MKRSNKAVTFFKSAIYPIVFFSMFFCGAYHASAQNATNSKKIDKSKLAIHKNLRDGQPQHMNNDRKTVVTRTKTQHRLHKSINKTQLKKQEGTKVKHTKVNKLKKQNATGSQKIHKSKLNRHK